MEWKGHSYMVVEGVLFIVYIVYISVSAFAIKTQVTCTSTDLTNSYRIESSDDGIMGS